MPPLLLPILPTRVRRNYRGGLLLDRLEQAPAPHDSDRPESWIASTTLAKNPGLPPEPDEGLTRVRVSDGRNSTLAACFQSAPEFYLGGAHAARHGPELGFLAKLLDSSMRLHVQAHPTAAFAQAHLGAPFGKLEVYYVLAVRPGAEGNLRLGFQRAPDRDRWRKIIETQDIVAMDACFEPIPVNPGDVWIVPGGMPHAIGAGVLMVEIMEPSDLVVRCEFEREGVVVPPGGRFMDRGLEFCLDIFDYSERSVAEIRERCQLAPHPLARGAGWSLDRLVGSDRTSCFEIRRVRASRPCQLAGDGRGTLVIQTRGAGMVSAGGATVPLQPGASVFGAAASDEFAFDPAGSEAEWILCSPAVAKIS